MLDVVGVHVFDLVLGDLYHLCLSDLADFLAMRLGRALLDTCGLEHELRRWRLLDDEGEGAVFIHVHQHREDRACLRTGLIVELLDEFGDIDARRTKGGTHRRSRCSSPRRELEFYDFGDFFCHVGVLYRNYRRFQEPWPQTKNATLLLG